MHISRNNTFLSCLLAVPAAWVAVCAPARAYDHITIDSIETVRTSDYDFNAWLDVQAPDGGLRFTGTADYELGKLSFADNTVWTLRLDVDTPTVPIITVEEFFCGQNVQLSLTFRNGDPVTGINYKLLSVTTAILPGSFLPVFADDLTEGRFMWIGQDLYYTLSTVTPGSLYFNTGGSSSSRGFYKEYSGGSYSSPVGDSEWNAVTDFSSNIDARGAYIKLSAATGESVTVTGNIGDDDTKGVWLAQGEFRIGSGVTIDQAGKIYAVDGRLAVGGGQIIYNDVYLGASQAVYGGTGYALHAEGNAVFAGAVTQMEETGILLDNQADLVFTGTYTSTDRLNVGLSSSGAFASIAFNGSNNQIKTIHLEDGKGYLSLGGSLNVSAFEIGYDSLLDVSGLSYTGLSSVTMGNRSTLALAANAPTLSLNSFSYGSMAHIEWVGNKNIEKNTVYSILTSSTAVDTSNDIKVYVNGVEEYAKWSADKKELQYQASYYWTRGTSTVYGDTTAFKTAHSDEQIAWTNGNNLILAVNQEYAGSTHMDLRTSMVVDKLIVKNNPYGGYTITTGLLAGELKANMTILEEGAKFYWGSGWDNAGNFISDVTMQKGSTFTFMEDPFSWTEGKHFYGTGTIALEDGGDFSSFIYKAFDADNQFSGVLRVNGDTLNADIYAIAGGLSAYNYRLQNTTVEVASGAHMNIKVHGLANGATPLNFALKIAGNGYERSGQPEYSSALSFTGDENQRFGGTLTLTDSATIYAADGLDAYLTGTIYSEDSHYALTKTGGGNLHITSSYDWRGDLNIKEGGVTLDSTRQALGTIAGLCLNKITIYDGFLDVGSQTTDMSYKAFMFGKDLTFAGEGSKAVKGTDIGFDGTDTRIVYAEGASGTAVISANIRQVSGYSGHPLQFSIAASADQSALPELTVTGNIGRTSGAEEERSFGITKIGLGTLMLSGDNAYTGGTQVNGGTLIAASASALGKGNVTVAAGGTLEMAAVVQGGLNRTLTVNDSGILSMDAGSSWTGNLVMETGSILDVEDNGTFSTVTTFSGSIGLQSGIYLSSGMLERASLGSFADMDDVIVLNSFSINVEAGQTLTLGGTTWYGTQLKGYELNKGYCLTGNAGLVFESADGQDLGFDLNNMGIWITFTGENYLITLSTAGNDDLFFNTGLDGSLARGFYKQYTDAFGYQRSVASSDWHIVSDFSQDLDVCLETDGFIQLNLSQYGDDLVRATGKIGYANPAGDGTHGVWITGGTVLFDETFNVSDAGKIFVVDGTLALSGDHSISNPINLGSNGEGSSLAFMGENTTLTGDVTLMEDTRIFVASGSKGTITGTVSNERTASLSKSGEGELLLDGEGKWEGGTVIELGGIIAKSANALGTGNVTIMNGGYLSTIQGLNLMNGEGVKSTLLVMGGASLQGVSSGAAGITAHLELEQGSVVDMDTTLTLKGSLSVGSGTILSDHYLEAAANGSWDPISIFSGQIDLQEYLALGGAMFTYDDLSQMEKNTHILIQGDASLLFSLESGSQYDLSHYGVYLTISDAESFAASSALNYNLLLVDSIPEPSSLTLGGLSAISLLFRRRRA